MSKHKKELAPLIRGIPQDLLDLRAAELQQAPIASCGRQERGYQPRDADARPAPGDVGGHPAEGVLRRREAGRKFAISLQPIQKNGALARDLERALDILPMRAAELVEERSPGLRPVGSPVHVMIAWDH